MYPGLARIEALRELQRAGNRTQLRAEVNRMVDRLSELGDRAALVEDGARPGDGPHYFTVLLVAAVTPERLEFRTYTTTGRLYDGFDLVRQPGGGNRLEETDGLIPLRRCTGTTGPDGVPCVARPKD